MSTRKREGYELVLGPGTINAWRKRQFSSKKEERELEIARAFCGALSDDLDAQKSSDEPFDIEIFSESGNRLVAGVQLVEAYDDARRRRDEERHRAMEDLRSTKGLSESLDGWCIMVQTATALASVDGSNEVANQLAVLRELLSQRVDWRQEQFSVSGSHVAVSGRRRHFGHTGLFWYTWHGGLLPFPRGSLFLSAAESKVKKHYSRSKKPPFWLLVYSLSLSPAARDRGACRKLLEKQKTFDDIFLLDVMGGTVLRLSEYDAAGDSPEETQLGAVFQIDPSSVMDPGSLAEDNLLEIKL